MTSIKLTELPSGLVPLAEYNQFVLWEKVPMRLYKGGPHRRRDLKKMGFDENQIDALPIADKTEKIPIDHRTLRYHSAHDQQVQLDFETAALTASTLPSQYGVGFVFTAFDPFYFVDVDACADPTQPNGWSPRANELMQRLAGASVEISQSGRGLHIIGRSGELPPRDCKYLDEFDLYTEGRFVALTGFGVVGSADFDNTQALTEICHQYLKPSGPIRSESIDSLSAGPCAEWSGHTDDTELINHALNVTSPMSHLTGKATFRDLWERNEDALARSYPDDQGQKPYDDSSADMALAQHLAFWTGKDGERIKRIMYQSALMRDKWEDRADYYIPRTISRACAMQTEVHRTRTETDNCRTDDQLIQPTINPDDVPENVSLTSGLQMMFINNQIEHFKNCVYVMDRDRILTPAGDLLKSTQFKVMYGGYTFVLDNENRKTTKNAWEAFTESQAIRHPKVHTLSFRPLETPGALTSDHYGRLSVNCFTPRYGARAAGDVTPFMTHIEKLLPHESDREILLSYLAACIQYAGHKFQWCVVLQGLMGNGKTALTEPLVHALGEQYCFQLNPKDAGNVFNAWVERKLLVVLEEIRVAGKTDMVESLKPLITNRRVAVQGKGLEQTTGDNFANFVMFSNHKDAVLKTIDDRRYCVFYTAQQDVDHLKRDGMDDAYFSELYAYLRGPGAAAVVDYLCNRPVTINVMGRAPETTSTKAAHYESLGAAEQIVLEAIDLEHPGFRGDMVSSLHAGNELAANGKRISPRAVGNMLRNINYITPPALESSNGKISFEGVRFRVYARRDRPVTKMNYDELRAHWEKHNK